MSKTKKKTFGLFGIIDPDLFIVYVMSGAYISGNLTILLVSWDIINRKSDSEIQKYFNMGRRVDPKPIHKEDINLRKWAFKEKFS